MLYLLKKIVTHFLVVGWNLLSSCLERNGDGSWSISFSFTTKEYLVPQLDLNLSYVSRMT